MNKIAFYMISYFSDFCNNWQKYNSFLQMYTFNFLFICEHFYLSLLIFKYLNFMTFYHIDRPITFLFFCVVSKKKIYLQWCFH